jgi:epoxide hydrolase-like predicted phosphatase
MTTPTALIVDWGGVLTGDLSTAIGAWASTEQIDLQVYGDIIGDWLGEPLGRAARVNPVHALERGEMLVPDFDARLAAALTERTGRDHVADGLLARMFEHFEHAPDMAALVRRARDSGLRTALLSNSWGNDYPREGWDDMFDEIVISGEVGMRKPEPRIFEHTVSLLGVPASQCVFVDDLRPNIAAAAECGLIGVHHERYERTRSELEALFGLDLS